MTTKSAVRSESSNLYWCPDSTCGQTFVDLDTFYKHWTRHREQCPFPLCRTKIDSKYNFGRHWARKHADHFAEFQHVEEMPCRINCGKSFSRADVSNRKRHEKTCHGNLRHSAYEMYLLHDNVTPAAIQGSDHTNNSEVLRHVDEASRVGTFQDSLSSALLKHNLQGRIIPARELGSWRDSRPILRAIHALQRNFVGGPAADGLEAFKTFLDSLGPSFQVPERFDSDSSKGTQEGTMVGQSDESADLDNLQRGCQSEMPRDVDSRIPDNERAITTSSKRRIDTEDADFSHASLKRCRPIGNQASGPTRRDKSEEIHATCSSEDDSGDGHITRCDEDRLVKVAVETIDMIRFHPDFDSILTQDSISIRSLQMTTSGMLSCFKLQSLDSNLICLALLFIYRLCRQECDIGCKLGSRRGMIGIALMLAERLYGRELHPTQFWAQVADIPFVRTINMETEFHTRSITSLSFDDESELQARLDSIFDRHHEFFGCWHWIDEL